MNSDEQKVTLVTRNDNSLGRAVLDLTLTAFAFYYITHPSMFEDMKDAVRKRWNHLIHKISVWQTQTSIQNLPEIDVEEIH